MTDDQQKQLGATLWRIADELRGAMNADDFRHGLDPAALHALVQTVLQRGRFDSDDLHPLPAPLNLGWKARSHKEVDIMADLAPLLRTLADGQEVHGLAGYTE